MSHANTNVIYPQSTDRDLSRWQVREDDDDHGKGSNSSSNVQTVSLLDLQDRIIDRLDRARALSQLLQTADIQLEHVVRDTALVLEEHIEQAQRTSRRAWEYIQRERKGG
jgi:hypothetical protein